MKIDIRTQGLALSDGLHEHIERCLNYGLDWSHQDVSRVVIRLSGINGPRGGNVKRCHHDQA
jgi:putative sigma-54 modulation protein